VLIDYMPRNSTAIQLYNADLLRKKHVAVKEMCCGKLTHVSLLLYDNASADKSRVGRAAVLKCRFEEMHHP